MQIQFFLLILILQKSVPDLVLSSLSLCIVCGYSTVMKQTSIYIYGFFFSGGPGLGESEVKTEIAWSLSQLGLLCSTYILF